MTDSNKAVEENKSESEGNHLPDASFLECLARAEALIDKCPMRVVGGIGERMIHLTSGVVLFALVLVETPDSFIVSYPSVLTNTDGRVTGRLMMETTQSRLFKSCIVTISEPSELHKFYYLRFLLEDLEEIPSVLTGKRLESVYDFLSLHKNKNPVANTTNSNNSDNPEEESSEEGEDRGYDDVPSGMLAPYRKKTRH